MLFDISKDVKILEVNLGRIGIKVSAVLGVSPLERTSLASLVNPRTHSRYPAKAAALGCSCNRTRRRQLHQLPEPG